AVSRTGAMPLFFDSPEPFVQSPVPMRQLVGGAASLESDPEGSSRPLRGGRTAPGRRRTPGGAAGNRPGSAPGTPSRPRGAGPHAPAHSPQSLRSHTSRAEAAHDFENILESLNGRHGRTWGRFLARGRDRCVFEIANLKHPVR